MLQGAHRSSCAAWPTRPKGIKMTTATLDSIATAIAGMIGPLPPAQRAELIGKISAASIGGTLESVGTEPDKITSITAATAEEARTKLTAIQAANASSNNLGLVRNALARAKRLGLTIKENELVDVDEMNRVFAASKDIDERMAVKTALARLRMI
jgi:hypothetical protein